jgi:hypothetical protein
MKPSPGKAGDLQLTKTSNTGDKDKNSNSGLYLTIGILLVTNIAMIIMLFQREKPLTVFMPIQDPKSSKPDTPSEEQNITLINSDKSTENGSSTNPA